MSLKHAECQPVNSNHRTCFENLLQKYRFTEKSRMMTHAVKFGSANKHVFLLNTIFFNKLAESTIINYSIISKTAQVYRFTKLLTKNMII